MTSTSTHKEAYAHYLNRFTCADLVPSDQQLITTDTKATLEDTIKLLNKHNLLSLPVWDPQHKKYVGIVNVFDIATAVAFRNLFGYDDHTLQNISDEEYHRTQNLEVFSHTVESCLGISDEGKDFTVLKAGDKLGKAISLFGSGMHRVLVAFEGTNIMDDAITRERAYVRMLSQTDIVRFLHINSSTSELSTIMSRKIKDLHLVPSIAPHRDSAGLVTIDTNNTALTGFRQMALRHVSAVGVVDDNYKLVSTLSTSDLRGMTRATFRNALLPVMDFLKVTRGQHREPVVCLPDDTLAHVVEKALQGHIHRLWVVESTASMRPVGVVSLTDIICLFYT